MSKVDPAWLPEARDFCREAKITIAAWGPDLLTVEAKSEGRAKLIASRLGKMGFHVIQSKDDSEAGMLCLSLTPTVVHSKIASYDISRRRWNERILPLIWAFCSLLLVPEVLGDAVRTPYWISFPIGFFSAIMFFRDSARIWGWRLELLPDGIRVRRSYRWSMIPWEQIRAIESVPARLRSEKAVVLKLHSAASVSLGSFYSTFASGLRDRLRIELAQRRVANEQL